MKRQKATKRSNQSYRVYVVELEKKVWSESRKFRRANPHYKGRMCCLYVGMTSHTPEERFEKHKTGYRNKKGVKISSAIVEKYGRYLRPSLYQRFNPMMRDEASQMEQDLARSLKMRGYGVWWN